MVYHISSKIVLLLVARILTIRGKDNWSQGVSECFPRLAMLAASGNGDYRV